VLFIMTRLDKNAMHAANRLYWDAQAPGWRKLRDQDQLWRLCPSQPELAFEGGALDLIRALGDLRGLRAGVVGSGDNYAAFALAGLGARVTSIDISAQQLQIAAERAAELGLEITFVQADAAAMDGIPSGEFDLVCSTNGFFVWIAALREVFAEISRVLKAGGTYISYDIHPFQRPWKDQVAPLEMEKPYNLTGPFIDAATSSPVYEFNWRMSDLLNPLLDAGLQLRKLVESPPKDPRFWLGASYVPGADASLADWKHNPRAGLPVWLTIAAQKPA
jgi:SAM-dependent methyltransferase